MLTLVKRPQKCNSTCHCTAWIISLELFLFTHFLIHLHLFKFTSKALEKSPYIFFAPNKSMGTCSFSYHLTCIKQEDMAVMSTADPVNGSTRFLWPYLKYLHSLGCRMSKVVRNQSLAKLWCSDNGLKTVVGLLAWLQHKTTCRRSGTDLHKSPNIVLEQSASKKTKTVPDLWLFFSQKAKQNISSEEYRCL